MAETLSDPALIKQDIFEKIEDGRKGMTRLMSYYKCAMMEIETKFKVLSEEHSFEWERNPIESIKCRLKSPESIAGKMVRRGLPFTLSSMEEKINDVAGVRVICTFIEDVYELSEILLQQDDITLIEKKDYIKNPKPNGYRSLHLIVAVPIFLADGKRPVKVEIQLRTIAMDFWASLEHELNYKKGYKLSEEIAAELYSCAQTSAMLDARMNALKRKVIDEGGNGNREEIVSLLENLVRGWKEK